MKTGAREYITFSLITLTSLSFLVLSSSRTLAFGDDSTSAVTDSTSAVTDTTIDVPVSCTMTGITDSAHTATLINGTYSGTDYATGIGQTTIRAFCNDNAGYAIYAIGYTNSQYGNTKLHWDGASNADDNTNAISTGIYTAGTTVNSTWSMKLASAGGTYVTTITDGTNNTEDYTDWHVIPEEYEKVAFRTTGTDVQVDQSGTGSSITVTYDSYISAGQPAGAYIGQVKFTLVHPSDSLAPGYPLDPLAATDCPANSICYAPNFSDVEGDMSSLGTISASERAGKQTKDNRDTNGGSNIASNTTSVVLIAPNFKRAGYGFAGWSTELDATTASNPVIYGPNQMIATNSGENSINLSTNGLILYPVWVASSGNLQGWTGCSSLAPASYDAENNVVSATLASVTGLTDTRDGNVYAVARLTDGLCWMIENLRLDAENTRGAENEAKAQGYAQSTTYGNFIGLADSEDVFGYNVTANSIYYRGTQSGTSSINIGTIDDPGWRMPLYNNNNTNMGGTNSNNTSLIASYNDNTTTAQWYGYGNYYSWPSAMASTKHFTDYYDASGDEQLNSDSAGTSICPIGWHLPLGGTSSDGTLEDGANDLGNRVGGFKYLIRTMGNSGYWLLFPNNFVLSGNIADVFQGRGYSGDYWSSSVENDNNDRKAFELSFGVESSSLTLSAGKSMGLSVRCVAGEIQLMPFNDVP